MNSAMILAIDVRFDNEKKNKRQKYHNRLLCYRHYNCETHPQIMLYKANSVLKANFFKIYE